MLEDVGNRIKEYKIISDFKEYVERIYLDFINEEMINEYIQNKHGSEEEKEILMRRFL